MIIGAVQILGNLGKLPNYVRYFGSNNVEGVAESWVEAEMSWVEVGERFTDTQFQYAYKKHVAQSNDGTYLAIPHLDLGGNDVVPKFSGIKGSHFRPKYTPTVPRVLLQKPFFYFIPLATIKTSCSGKWNSVFPLIFIGHSLALNSLSNHLEVTFQQTLY